MQRQRRRAPIEEASAPEPGQASVLLADRTRESVAEELVRRGRRVIAPLELWLLDRADMRLHRPDLGGLQPPAEVQLDASEPLRSWPDTLRVPGPQPTAGLAAFAAMIGGRALGRVLRVGDETFGVIVATHRGPRAPVTLDRRLATVGAETTAVLANHDAIRSARERADRLSALYETAHQLSSELDLEGVLQKICARARALTGCELAYIMLTDRASRYAYIRVADGVRNPAFMDVRLDFGDGLGGLVAKEGKTYYASDYLNDQRFIHLGPVDDAVSDEGIVSVIGVPLEVGDGVIGVLFAAYRRRTVFSDPDVAFLESLGEHASIALANAALHERTSEALARERRMHEVAEEQRDALERLTALHEQLTSLVLEERPMDDLLREVASALGHAVRLADEPDPEAASVAVAAGTTTLGWLVAPRDADVHAVEQAARVVTLHLLRDRAVVQARYRIRGEFLDELLRGDAAGDAVRRGSYLGLELSVPLAVVFALPGADDDIDYVHAVSQAAGPDALVAARGGGVVVVAPAAEPRALASRIAAALAERDVTITIGIAPDPVQVDGLEDALSDARRAAHAAASSGRRGDVVSRQDLGIHALLHEDHGELRTFAERLLHPLLDYDDTHDSNLLATLDAYLDSGGNATETARRLILHVNSLYYRLGRIRELGAYDLDDPDTRFELQLALRVLRAAT